MNLVLLGALPISKIDDKDLLNPKSSAVWFAFWSVSAINACSGKQAGNILSFTLASQSKQSKKSSFSSPKKSLSLSRQGQAEPWTLGRCRRWIPGTEGTGVWQGKCLLPGRPQFHPAQLLWHTSQHTDQAGCITGSGSTSAEAAQSPPISSTAEVWGQGCVALSPDQITSNNLR